MVEPVDSYRFLDFATRRLVKAWIGREPPHEAIPWTPLAKPLGSATVALVSTAALALATDEPFDQEGERRNPWWGDPSYRVIPREAESRDVRLYHLHMDPRPVEEDLECVFPLRGLDELAGAGAVGRSAHSHYSFMGYVLDPEVLLEESVPAMVARMRAELVDLALLVPY